MRSVSGSSVSSMSSTSSNSSTSRTSSPTPSETSLNSTSSTRSNGSFRLVPCELENADAVVLVTEPTDGSSHGKTLLLVGPAAQPYRQPSTRPTTKGARVHPYKIAPGQSLSRRSSTLSINSQLNWWGLWPNRFSTPILDNLRISTIRIFEITPSWRLLMLIVVYHCHTYVSLWSSASPNHCITIMISFLLKSTRTMM